MKRFIKITLGLVLTLISMASQAQQEVQMADSMRADGKIYVVVAIILIVLVGLIVYLFSLDRKVKKLENLLTGKTSSTK